MFVNKHFANLKYAISKSKVPLMYSTGLLCFILKRTYFTNGSPVFNISPG